MVLSAGEALGIVLRGVRVFMKVKEGMDAYGLRYVINDDGAVGVSVVHWCEGLVSFLARCVPYFELDGCGVVEGDGLGEEGGADGGLSVVIELILRGKEY